MCRAIKSDSSMISMLVLVNGSELGITQ